MINMIEVIFNDRDARKNLKSIQLNESNKS